MMLVTGGIPSGEDFYEGRRKYIQILAGQIQKQEVALIGPRRTGKTSIIHAYFEQLESSNERIPLYINLESCSTPYDIITEIGKKLLEQKSGLRAIFNNATEKANEWATQIKEHFDSVDLTHESGSSLKIKLRHVSVSKLEALGFEFKKLCGSTEKNIVIALDELPEAIWKYVNKDFNKEDRESRINHIGILLSFFRDIRQTNKASGKLRVIYSGSINFVLTLKKLGFAEDHNDLAHFSIPFLTVEETKDVANQLVKGEKIQISDQSFFQKIMEEQFGNTTPYYVQLYIEQLKNIVQAKSIGHKITNEDMVRAFQYVLSAEFGPEYFYRRIEAYHSENKDSILNILKFMATKQSTSGLPTSVEDLSSILTPASLLEIEDLLRELFVEDFFQLAEEISLDKIFSESNKYYFASNIIKNYWVKKLKNF
ncbi:MAG: hypothetical protein HQK51_17220 [Oligoflexia bacterium]|nr:hypothetical protein [Oligoflexia bacterium]